ncbi:odorant receptor 131-2-like [Megalops cyprinoides]|uniref:odorant receptor 131-2-like n=1 Tax=Megalops cyprinoides TaxID=118141 RepID=UPI001863B403|nr:odorant receptor 131-2-like [Megalops cyprinoides]
MAQTIPQYTNLSNIPAPLLSRSWNEKIVLMQVMVGIFLYVNCLMICTFFKKEAFRTDTRYILFAQTLITDSALMVFTDLALIGSYFQIPVPCIPCVIMCTIMVWLLLSTPLTLVAMCLERYVAICMPLRHASISTARTRLLGLVLIWCLAGIPALIVFLIFAVSVPLKFFSSYLICSLEMMIIHNWQAQFRAVLFQFYFLIMSITIGFTYVKIMAAAKGASSNKKSASKGLRTVVLHAFQLLLCLIQLLSPYVEMAVMKIDYMLFINVRYSNFIIFVLAPRCLSPLIYGLRDEKFVVVLRYYAVFGLNKKSFHFCKLCPYHLKHGKTWPLNGK